MVVILSKHTQQRSKNGREAYFIVKKQVTRQVANTICKKQAYAKITTAKYTRRGRFPLQQYILGHQQAHNTLSKLGKAVAEIKKMTGFLNEITDPSLTPAKLVLNGNKGKLRNFKQCQQYFQTVISAMKTDAMNNDQRKVAAIQTKKKPGNNNKRKGWNN